MAKKTTARKASKAKPVRLVTRKNSGTLSRLVRLNEGFVESFDGTKIYYKSIGLGYPLVLCNGLGVSTFFWKYLEEHFKHQFKVITWDYRGHGRSEHPRKNIDVHSLVKDCKAVCQQLKVKKGLFIGHSLGAQVVLEFYRTYPRQVGGIVSCFGTVGRPMDFFYNSPWSKYIFEIISSLSLKFPKQSSLLNHLVVKNPFWFQLAGLLKMINTGMANKSDAQQYMDHLLSLDSEFLTKLTLSVQAHTAEEVLKDIKVPMLIIGGEQDTFTPVWLAKKMHRIVTNSELFVIRKGSHAAIVEQPELINLRLEKFIHERIKLPNK